MAANYVTVGDEGDIYSSGEITGDHRSGTQRHLLGVSHAGVDRASGIPLVLACGDDGVCLRMGLDNVWETRPTDTGRDLNGVCFARGTKTAWVVGDEGTILKTTNGGGLFGVQTSNTSLHIYCVWAADEQLVYAGGDGATVWRTENGGSTWTRVHHGDAVVGAGVATTSIDRATFRGIHA